MPVLRHPESACDILHHISVDKPIEYQSYVFMLMDQRVSITDNCWRTTWAGYRNGKDGMSIASMRTPSRSSYFGSRSTLE
jgi:hypothetical protein